MKPLVTRNIEELRPYKPGKPIEETEREIGVKNLVKMASNENPLGPSPKAVEAIQKAAEQMHIYPDGGCYMLKERLAKHLSKYDVEPHNLIIGNGSNEVIEFIIRTFVAADENIVIGDPSFIIYRLAGISHNREEIAVPLRDDLTCDLEAIYNAVNAKTKVIFLASPNNPTGIPIYDDEFVHFMTHVRDDVIICIDEAYAEFVDDPKVLDGLQYAPYRHRLVVLRTFSKIYGLAGLRIGYGVSSADLVSYMDRVRPPFNVNRMAQIAACAALDDPAHVKKTQAVNASGRKEVEDTLTQMGVKWYPSQANFLLIDLGKPSGPVFDTLLHKGFITRQVDNYGLPNCLRVTIGTEDQNRGFIEALRESLL
ncbi:histidinol-phosphate transaminase [candidate division KSB1 bacterium]|nr:histidinol-phosphate transaminase [candidate division KSB1 bacterium]